MQKRALLSLFIFTFIFQTTARCDEGMWLPFLLKQLNEADMQSKGLRLSAEDIYSVNRTSLKDAVVLFGGGCTGEMISSEGLLLTNHHCGFSQIQAISSVKNDYISEGFWAKKRTDEIACPGLTVTFIVRVDSVTAKVLTGVQPGMTEMQRDILIHANIREIESAASKGTKYQAKVKSFFNGNQYYMIISETFRDVRIVGAPPQSIGNFGGDTDNWMWPRHGGDFALFRVYSDADNRPADYSPDNKPYQPKHHFPISLKGIQKGDFTMVYGFPGRTSEYITSYAVKQIYDVLNPLRIMIRERRLEMFDEDMKRNDEVRIKYAAKYQRLSNYHKKWIGENNGLKYADAIGKKQEMESNFAKWLEKKPETIHKYKGVLPAFEKNYRDIEKLSVANDLLNEAAFGIELVNLSYNFLTLVDAEKKKNISEENLNKEIEKLKGISKRHFKDYNQATDRKVFPHLLRIYRSRIDASLLPDIFLEIDRKFKGDYEKYADHVFKKSFLTDELAIFSFLDNYKPSSLAKLKSDPAFALMNSILSKHYDSVYPNLNAINATNDSLSRIYMAGQMEMLPEKKFYPDANSTLRITYGKVDTYSPRDGVTYEWQTTLKGVMEKGVPFRDEFELKPRLAELFRNKDFGPYGKDGEMPVCFIGSNHTTGGNSGSPVLNGEGHLIGTNFDRNWEGTMSDIIYNPDRVRNIAVDIRYTLFIIDKFAGAKHLVDEMTIVN